jgi:Tfp pilus assembly protein PilV
MFDLKRNDRGISLVEVTIALFLTTIGVLAVMSLQPTAWKTAARSDYMGRAAGILQKELETREAFIMNCCNAVTLGTSTSNVLASGAPATQPGDATFTVTTTIACVAPAGSGVYSVAVRVAWTGHAGIIEYLRVTRQQSFQGTCTTCTAGC